MLRAIIFDFNGVIIDDEPLHFRAFREALAKVGIRLTRKIYYERYLAYDDRRCVAALFKDFKKAASGAEVTRLCRAKKRAYDRLLRTQLKLFPGAISLVRSCAARYPVAIASGALRSEIRHILRKYRLESCFAAVVSADDVVNGKPHPESFLRALQALNAKRSRGEKKLRAAECVVIEDSLHGVDAAHEAGMKCMAVAHSYPLKHLKRAEGCVPSIRSLRLSRLESLFTPL